jgi:DNA helicase-2/ATP-dependent DNA helicase PcrA
VERIENIKELAALAGRYDQMSFEEGVEKLLEDTALASDQDSDKKEKDGVRLMTVHASKGLEFAYVFITGLEEGLFPHERNNNENISEEDAEEENAHTNGLL